MKQIIYKIHFFFKNLIKDLDKKNREELIYELLIAGDLDKDNIEVFNIVNDKFKKYLLIKEQLFNLEIEEIKLFTKDFLIKEENFIEDFGYNIEFIKKNEKHEKNNIIVANNN